MEFTEPLAIDNEFFLNYERNVLREPNDKEYFTIVMKTGESLKFLCQHRHWYGKYTFQDEKGELSEILLENIQSLTTEGK